MLLAGQCLTQEIVYDAKVTIEGESESDSKIYVGQTSRPFKERFYEHTQAIKNEKSARATALSNYVHKLKKAGKDFTIKWSIRGKAPPYQNGQKKCLLCIREKTTICLTDPKRLLNNRSEMLSKCIHRAKFELRKFYNPP